MTITITIIIICDFILIVFLIRDRLFSITYVIMIFNINCFKFTMTIITISILKNILNILIIKVIISIKHAFQLSPYIIIDMIVIHIRNTRIRLRLIARRMSTRAIFPPVQVS